MSCEACGRTDGGACAQCRQQLEARLERATEAAISAAMQNGDLFWEIAGLKGAIAKAQAYLTTLPGQANDSALGALLAVHPFVGRDFASTAAPPTRTGSPCWGCVYPIDCYHVDECPHRNHPIDDDRRKNA